MIRGMGFRESYGGDQNGFGDRGVPGPRAMGPHQQCA